MKTRNWISSVDDYTSKFVDGDLWEEKETQGKKKKKMKKRRKNHRKSPKIRKKCGSKFIDFWSPGKKRLKNQERGNEFGTK
jgi:hypothetical protein